MPKVILGDKPAQLDDADGINPCQKIDIPLWICQTYWLNQVLFSCFFLLWNGVVAMVLVSVSRYGYYASRSSVLCTEMKPYGRAANSCLVMSFLMAKYASSFWTFFRTISSQQNLEVFFYYFLEFFKKIPRVFTKSQQLFQTYVEFMGKVMFFVCFHSKFTKYLDLYENNLVPVGKILSFWMILLDFLEILLEFYGVFSKCAK